MIQLNDFKRQWQETSEDLISAFTAVGESGWYVLGSEVRAFEMSLGCYWGVSQIIGLASGLDAIELSLKALGCRAGDRVLTTPLSAFPTTLAIVKLGAVPVFVDTDDAGLIDLDLCHSALAARPDIRFFVPVHLYGHALDLCRLQALRNQFECCIVEDCAQSIGANHNGLNTGTAGQLAATSFYPTKNLGTFGDGGAILANDEALAEKVRMLRDYGQSSKYRHDVIGYNSRLDELHASLMRRVFLPLLPRWTERRRAIASAYISGIQHPAIRIPQVPAGSASCWHLFPVLVDPARKADLIVWLRSRGIASGEHYPIPIPCQRALLNAPFESIGGIQKAASFCQSELSLPIHPYLEDREVIQVIQACNEWQV